MKHEKEIAVARVADAYGLDIGELPELLELMSKSNSQQQKAATGISIGVLIGMKIGTQTNTKQ